MHGIVMISRQVEPSCGQYNLNIILIRLFSCVYIGRIAVPIALNLTGAFFVRILPKPVQSCRKLPNLWWSLTASDGFYKKKEKKIAFPLQESELYH